MKISKTTPVICVDSIENDLPFWTETLGYVKVAEVPHQGKIGFVILKKEGSEIMLQTHPSLMADLPAVAKTVGPGSIYLYSEVDSIEAALAALKSVKPLVPLRSTDYGAKEIFVQTNEGNVLGFAEHSS